MAAPDPALELELEQRFEAKADWAAHRTLVARVELLEEWRAGLDGATAARGAAATVRRWLVPTIISAIAVAATLVNLVFTTLAR